MDNGPNGSRPADLFPMIRILAILTMTVFAAHADSWKVGKPFPSLNLPTIDGKAEPQVADFQGKKLMLHVFASW